MLFHQRHYSILKTNSLFLFPSCTRDQLISALMPGFSCGKCPNAQVVRAVACKKKCASTLTTGALASKLASI
jgi:hypothetical protein